MSSRCGSAFTIPLKLGASTSSQEGQPRRAHGFLSFGENRDGSALFGNFNAVANLHLKGRDGDLMTVQRKDAVADQLTGLSPGVGEAEAVHDVVQTAFEESEQVRAGHALRHIGVDEVTVELLFQNAINATHLLLFTQLDGVVAQFFTGAAMLTGRVGAAVKGALVGEATVALQQELRAFTTAQTTFGIIIFGQGGVLL